MPAVALRKESVDRNHSIGNIPLHIVGSLSARRAWIEINVGFPIAAFLLMVALRKESVDRNLPGHRKTGWCLPCRSPQGERG